MKQIYIHGLGQTADSWNAVTEKVNMDGEIICPNLAEMVEYKQTTYSNLYDEFSELCNSIDEDIFLCGLSLGGVLALNYAIDHPKKVKALVLISTQYKMPKKLLKLQNVLFRFTPESAFQQTGFTKSDFISLCSTMAELDFSDLIHKVSCPTLIVCGEKDRANTGASVKLAGILDSKLIKILGAGHEVNVEAPEKLAEILKEFYITI